MGIIDNVNNFINKTTMSVGEVILTSVISTLVSLVLASIFKSFFIAIWDLIKKFFLNIKKYIRQLRLECRRLYRRSRGFLTINEYIRLSERQKNGENLTKKESELLKKNEEHFKDALVLSKEQREKFDEAIKNMMSTTKINLPSYSIPDLSKFPKIDNK